MSNPTTPREIIASLRWEITAMKKEWEEERREIASLRAHAERVGQANDRLVVENAALRADKERLDWMASADYWADIAVYRTPQALRVAIDAARKEAQP